jgi:hypothetical protein
VVVEVLFSWVLLWFLEHPWAPALPDGLSSQEPTCTRISPTTRSHLMGLWNPTATRIHPWLGCGWTLVTYLIRN